MEKKTVPQLKAIAKKRGFTHYSRLLKGDLLKLLESAPQEYVHQSSSNGGTKPPTPTPRPRTKKPPTPTPRPRTKKPPTPAPRTEKTFQRGREIVSNFIQSGTELVESLPKKSLPVFNWVRSKANILTNKVKDVKQSIAEMINKNLSQLTGNREPKPNNSVSISDDVKKEIDNRQFRFVESRSSLKKFVKQYTIDVRQKGVFTDLKELLSAVQPLIINHLRKNRNVKAKIVVECVMSKTDLETGDQKLEIAFFHGLPHAIFKGTNLTEIYDLSVDKIMDSLSCFQKEGSGWVIESIENVTLHTIKHQPLSGSSYIPLPPKIKNKKAIINMKNEDNECFKWCVTRALNPVDKNAERITKKLREQSLELKWEGIKFPVELKDIHKFEALNEINVNVLGYDDENKVYPLRPSVFGYSTEINLLLIHKDENKHYCLIKDMSRLLASQTTKNERKEFYCMRCLNSFGRQDLLDDHKELCGQHEGVKVVMPKKGSSVSFGHHHKKIDVPFYIIADFESMMKAFHTAQPNPDKSYTMKQQKHKPDGFCYFIKCTFDDQYDKLVEYRAKSVDEDVAQRFVEELEKEVKSIYTSHPPKRMIFTNIDNNKFNEADKCWICGGGGFDEKNVKVRDHCYFTGKFRGAAHKSCSLEARVPKFTPVYFHNLSGYDAHLFIKNLGVSEGKIGCIPNNKEKYISFTKEVEVDKFVDKEGKERLIKRELRFLDSAKFMNSSLANLVANLGDSDFVNTGRYFSKSELELLKRKGVYPYEWMDSLDKMNETQLPKIEAFYSSLTGESITTEDYKHAQNVWKTFNMKTFGDYHDLYNKSDVLLLADVFENFRKVCKKNYELDPCWYYTAPGLAWDACLKLTKINLELLTDPDMLLMVESGLRGGISMISKRHAEANNKYMSEKFDSSKPSKYIVYHDELRPQKKFMQIRLRVD